IGVLPQPFHFLDWEDPAVIIPFQFDRNKTHLGNFSYDGLARVKPGVTVEQVNADVARMLPMVMSSFPTPPGFSIKLLENAHIGPNVRPLKRDVVGDVGSVLWVLMGSIGMVLLIACANVANLLLVRVEGRRQELAVRAALGASRGRIAADLLLESVMLGLLGSTVGLGLAYAALRILAAIAPAGFAGPSALQTFRISIPSTLVEENERVVRTEEEILHRLAAIPGVLSVGISSKVPMTGGGWSDPIFIENHTYAEGELPPLRSF